MDIFKKAVRRSPNIHRGKHKKLGEGWAENTDTVSEGITFYLKYLGSTLVEELRDGDSYSGRPSARAIAAIVAMAKSTGKKLRKVSLCVSYRGLKIVDLITFEDVLDVSIYRISFCTADKNYDKVFAFMARNKVNETVQCHAFLCAKTKIAEAVTLTVSQAFTLAKEMAEGRGSHPNKNLQKFSASNEKSNNVDEDSPTLPTDDDEDTTNGSSFHNWEIFDESPHKAISSTEKDDFSRLATCRLHPPTFTDPTPHAMEDVAVCKYQRDPSLSWEELQRAGSVDDLLTL